MGTSCSPRSTQRQVVATCGVLRGGWLGGVHGAVGRAEGARAGVIVACCIPVLSGTVRACPCSSRVTQLCLPFRRDHVGQRLTAKVANVHARAHTHMRASTRTHTAARAPSAPRWSLSRSCCCGSRWRVRTWSRGARSRWSAGSRCSGTCHREAPPLRGPLRCCLVEVVIGCGSAGHHQGGVRVPVLVLAPRPGTWAVAPLARWQGAGWGQAQHPLACMFVLHWKTRWGCVGGGAAAGVGLVWPTSRSCAPRLPTIDLECCGVGVGKECATESMRAWQAEGLELLLELLFQ